MFVNIKNKSDTHKQLFIAQFPPVDSAKKTVLNRLFLNGGREETILELNALETLYKKIIEYQTKISLDELLSFKETA